MPIYYFHVRKDGILERDPKGAEFANVDATHDEALEAAREILAEKVLADDVVDGSCFKITDQDGAVLREVPFRSAIQLN